MGLNIEDYKEFRVKSTTASKKLGSAIAEHIRQNTNVVLTACGAGPVNQALKASIIAGTHLIANNIRISLIPAFHSKSVAALNGEGETEEHTIIRLFIRAEHGN